MVLLRWVCAIGLAVAVVYSVRKGDVQGDLGIVALMIASLSNILSSILGHRFSARGV